MFNKLPAKIVGIESIKEYCVAKFLSKPQRIPAAIVEPERDIPGIIAKA